ALAWFVDDRLARLGLQFVDNVPALFAAYQNPTARAGVANAGADALRAPALVGRQVGEVGSMALPRVKDVVPFGAHRLQRCRDRLDRRAGQREIIAHLVDIAAFAAEIGLHVDDDDRGVVRTQFAVARPGIGIRIDRRHDYFAMANSPGISRAERLALEVAIMMPSVRMYGAALKK